jgi:hypothetical protein
MTLVQHACIAGSAIDQTSPSPNTTETVATARAKVLTKGNTVVGPKNEFHLTSPYVLGSIIRANFFGFVYSAEQAKCGLAVSEEDRLYPRLSGLNNEITRCRKQSNQACPAVQSTRRNGPDIGELQMPDSANLVDLGWAIFPPIWPGHF